MRLTLLVGLGGFAGSCFRYWAGLAGARLAGVPTPWATAFVNVTGCFAIGLLAARSLSPELRAFALVGVLGGYTTFSTFGYETFVLFEQGRAGLALRERGRTAGPRPAGRVRGHGGRAGDGVTAPTRPADRTAAVFSDAVRWLEIALAGAGARRDPVRRRSRHPRAVGARLDQRPPPSTAC